MNSFMVLNYNLIKLLMNNPERSFALPPNLIYSYDTHRNIPWNDTEYQPPRVYEDPIKQIAQRRYQSSPKDSGIRNYVTRKGFYMDYHIKVVKALPSPADQNLKDPWDQQLNEKKSQHHKLDLKLSKYSYLDLISTEQKNRSTPAPGTYNLNKSEEEIQKRLNDLKSQKRYEGNKHYFYEDTQHVSNQTPGMGSYNPHDEVPHLKMNKTTHKLWIDKHKKEGEKFAKRKSVQPAPGTHTPIPLGYTTFDRIMTSELTARKKKEKSFSHGFGTDSKFEYTRPAKKKIIEQRPASCTYNLALQWKGKNMQQKGNNWMTARSLGRSQSVYH